MSQNWLGSKSSSVSWNHFPIQLFWRNLNFWANSAKLLLSKKKVTLANLNSITVWLGLWWFMEATNRTIHLLCWSNCWNFSIWVDDGSLWSCMDNQDGHCEYIDHRICYTICKWILYVCSVSISDGFKLSNIFHMHSHVK